LESKDEKIAYLEDQLAFMDFLKTQVAILETVQQELESKEDKITELEEVVADIDDFKNQLAAKTTVTTMLRSQNDRLKQTNKELLQQVEEKKKEPTTDSADQGGSTSARSKKLEARAEGTRIRMLENDIIELNNKLESAKRDMATGAERKKLREDLQGKKLQAALGKNGALKEKVTTLKQEVDSLTKRLKGEAPEKTASDIDKSSSHDRDAKVLKRKNERLKASLLAAKRSEATLAGEHERLKANASSLDEMLAENQAKTDLLQAQVKFLQTQLDEAYAQENRTPGRRSRISAAQRPSSPPARVNSPPNDSSVLSPGRRESSRFRSFLSSRVFGEGGNKNETADNAQQGNAQQR